MKQPKVSIIVPIYNVERYLDRCMHSLLNQTLEDIEIIMVDDGSPDNCPKMCDEYAKKDGRVKVIHKQNAGLGYARNTGLEFATGEYVAFVDSDDYVEQDMYEIMFNTAIEKECDAVYGGFRIEVLPNKWKNSDEVDEDKCWEGDDIKKFMLDMIASEAHQPQERLFQMSVWHAVYKNSVIERNHLKFISERDVVSEDIPFQVDFLQKSNRVAYLNKVFYSYCLNGASLTSTLKPEKYERFKKLRNCLLLKSEDKEYRNRVNRLFIGYTRSHLYDIVNSNWKNKRDMIRLILNDKIWEILKKEYNPDNLPRISRIIYKMMLINNSFLLLLMMSFLNIFRKYLGGQDLFRQCLKDDLKRYDNGKPKLKDWLLHNEVWYIFYYIRHLRYVEYYKNKNKFLYLWHFFRYKRLGFKLKMTIYPNTVGPGFRIYHAGDFVHIGPNVHIGKNCTMLPGVVFGNKTEKPDTRMVTVGDNCYFGLGVKIFGPVNIGDNVTIGANAVVTKDIPDDSIVVGIPAKIIKRYNHKMKQWVRVGV